MALKQYTCLLVLAEVLASWTPYLIHSTPPLTLHSVLEWILPGVPSQRVVLCSPFKYFSSPKTLTAQCKLAVSVCFYFSRQTVNSWGTPSKYYDIWCAVMAFKRFVVVVVIVERLTDFFWKRGQHVLWLLASWVSVYNQPEDWIRAPSRIHSWLVHFPDAPRTCYHTSNQESTEARVILK